MELKKIRRIKFSNTRRMKILNDVLIFTGAWLLGYAILYLTAPESPQREVYSHLIGWWLIFFYSYFRKFSVTSVLIIYVAFCVGSAVLFEMGESNYHDPPDNLFDYSPIILMRGLLLISPTLVAVSVRYIVKQFPEIFNPD